MGSNNMEPEQLKLGKEFHKKVQSNWKNGIIDGHLIVEHKISFLSSNSRIKYVRTGRLDMFIDELGDFFVVIEIKSTDWEKVKIHNLRKLLSSHKRQIWKYISKYVDDDKMDVCPGIIYPKAPKDSTLRNLIESYLNEEGIQVVWYNL